MIEESTIIEEARKRPYHQQGKILMKKKRKQFHKSRTYDGIDKDYYEVTGVKWASKGEIKSVL